MFLVLRWRPVAHHDGRRESACAVSRAQGAEQEARRGYRPVKVEVGPQWRIAQAEKIRAAMGPEFAAVADSLRETFGAKLTWLETPRLSTGTKPEEGVPSQWHGERKRA